MTQRGYTRQKATSWRPRLTRVATGARFHVLPVSRFLTIPPEQRAFHLDSIPGADIVPGFIIITHSTVPASSLVDPLALMYSVPTRERSAALPHARRLSASIARADLTGIMCETNCQPAMRFCAVSGPTGRVWEERRQQTVRCGGQDTWITPQTLIA